MKDWVEYWIRYPQLSLRVMRMIRAERVSRKHDVDRLTPREEFVILMNQFVGRCDEPR